MTDLVTLANRHVKKRSFLEAYNQLCRYAEGAVLDILTNNMGLLEEDEKNLINYYLTGLRELKKLIKERYID